MKVVTSIEHIQSIDIPVETVGKSLKQLQRCTHTMDNLTKFFDSVDALIRITEDNQVANEGWQAMMAPGMWLREMSTVNLVVPRRVGKTSYIAKRARCADLVIVHNHEMKREYRDSRAQVITIPELMGLIRGRTGRGFNRVYIDEPSLVFKTGFSIDELYSLFCGEYGSHVCANMFIMLGT